MKISYIIHELLRSKFEFIGYFQSKFDVLGFWIIKEYCHLILYMNRARHEGETKKKKKKRGIT